MTPSVAVAWTSTAMPAKVGDTEALNTLSWCPPCAAFGVYAAAVATAKWLAAILSTIIVGVSFFSITQDDACDLDVNEAIEDFLAACNMAGGAPGQMILSTDPLTVELTCVVN